MTDAIRTAHFAALGILLTCVAACTDTKTVTAPAAPPVTPTSVDPGDEAPEILVEIISTTGGSAPGGAFVPGDSVAVRFAVRHLDGEPWGLGEMVSAEALLSGPTKNYQRVIPLTTDVVAKAISHGDGSYTYRFSPLPATYAAPLNDTVSFGVDEGELTGEALLEGTYTAGLSFAWDYEVAGDPFTEVGEATVDFLLGGGAGELAPRGVTQDANCNRCHVQLEAHEGRYRTLTMCLMCHTAGAEDGNDPTVAAGTPDVTIESRVMFHKIHNAKHLPSVIGIGHGADTLPDYTTTPKALLYAGEDGTVHDFSEVGFPAWPNREIPVAEGFFYAGLTAEAKAKENLVRTGVTGCYLCHLDPDGAGPIEAPPQGELIYAQQSRKACGACHDDIDWTLDYTGDLGTMEPQLDDTNCQECHAVEVGNPFSPIEAHLHPLRNPAFNTGTVALLLGAQEAGTHNGDGTFDPGERIEMTVAFENDSGAALDPAGLDEVRVVLSGPTSNANLVHTTTVPADLLSGSPPFTLPVPEARRLEYLGDATAVLGDVFMTSMTPHLDISAAPTIVGVRIGFGAGLSLTAAAAPRGQNFLDLLASAGFERGDFVVVSDGTPAEEYFQVQFVDGTRLWLSSPNSPDFKAALELDQPAGAIVAEVVLAPKVAGVDYTLDAASGALTELFEFGAGNAVLVDYWTDFVVPDRFVAPLNDSPDVGETLGEWAGKGLVEGTYTLGVFASRLSEFSLAGLTLTEYRFGSEAATLDVLVGGALTLEPYGLIDDFAACNRCHQDLSFHAGRSRGFASCLLCHGGSGGEDLPPYVAGSAPPTSGARIDLRSMLHRIHNARELDDPAAFVLVGETEAAYPDNFEAHTYSSILFPAWPGATRNCRTCHGDANPSWLAPEGRDHPTEQTEPALVWRATCVACHDSPAAGAHMDVQTSRAGVESCLICHGPGEELSVENAHRPR